MPHFLVVGATSGLGLAYSNHLKAKGFTVSRLGRSGNSSDFFFLELESRESIHNAMRQVLLSNGQIDSIVFCHRFRTPEDVDSKSEYSVNCLSISIFLENWKSLFKPDGFRSVVIVSSLAAKYPDLETPLSYQISKSAVNALARFYALKLGPEGVRVNVISPFFFTSTKSRRFYSRNHKWNAFINDRIPLRRSCSASELFPKIDFLTSEASSYITGQNLFVDGGATLRIYP